MSPAEYRALPQTASTADSADIGPFPRETEGPSAVQDPPQIVPADAPDAPPNYEPSPEFEELALEDPAPPPADTLRSKANRFASDFNRHVVQPLHQALDPVYQLYCYCNAQFELYVAKLGNPLIVKRVLFISLVTLVLYLVSLSGITTHNILSASDFVDFSIFEDFIETSIDAGRIEETIEYMSSMPHLSGTAGDLAIAGYFDQTIRSGALLANPNIIFQSYHNYPQSPMVALLEKGEVTRSFTMEEAIPELDSHPDNYFAKAFNPGSKPGTARGKFVYANYGEVSDYKKLADMNVDVSDRIVLLKYGGVLPAYTKLRYAQERGAKAVLFISDPIQQDLYTKESLQREPVAFADLYPGNIVSPGPLVTVQDQPLDTAEERFNSSPVAPNIPSLPITWNDFEALMEKMTGHGTRVEEWGFSLGDKHVEVWVGESDYELDIDNNLVMRPNKESWNVMGKLPGREQDNYAVVIAASRDSLCFGAMESSGSAILLELINLFSDMSQTLRWKPLRSIFFVSYSGSKFNMAGSTYFPVKQSDFFRRDVYAVIDLDDIIQGDKLQVEGDPIFHSVLKESITRAMQKYGNSTHPEYDENTPFSNVLNPYDNTLATTEHHGVSRVALKLVKSLNSNTPQYYKNSCLDTFQHFKDSRIDPDLSKHAFMTKLMANVIIGFAETPILPYDIDSAIHQWTTKFKEIVDYLNQRKSQEGATDELKRISHDNVVTLLNHMHVIADQHRGFSATWNDLTANAKASEPNLLAVNRWDWNAKLLLFLKVMLSVNGIYDNPWKYNLFHGREINPGSVIDAVHGYYPGIWNAINKGDWVAVQEQINLLSDMLQQGLDLFQY